MLCGHREVPVGGGNGVVGTAVCNNGSCKSGSWSDSSEAAAAAELDSLVGRAVPLALALVGGVSDGPAACAVRQQRIVQQQPRMNPRMNTIVMNINVHFRVLSSSISFVGLA